LVACGASGAGSIPSDGSLSSSQTVAADSPFNSLDSLENELSSVLLNLYRREAVTTNGQSGYAPTADLTALKQTWSDYVASSRVSYSVLNRLFELPVILSETEEVRAYITGIDRSYAENNSLNKNILEISLLSERESGARSSFTYMFYVDDTADSLSLSDLVIALS
jgi:hypothetical protein